MHKRPLSDSRTMAMPMPTGLVGLLVPVLRGRSALAMTLGGGKSSEVSAKESSIEADTSAAAMKENRPEQEHPPASSEGIRILRRCSFSTALSSSSCSIMTVRTLDESLLGSPVSACTSCAKGFDGTCRDNSIPVPPMASKEAAAATCKEIQNDTMSSGNRTKVRSKGKTKRETAPHRSVTFTSTEVREYPIELGDNPSVSSGPPLTIGWTYISRHKIPIDDYEAGRPPHRALYEMIIPSATRMGILCDADISLRSIQKAIKEVNVTKRQRRRTVQTLQTSWIEEMSERTRSAVLGRTLRSSERRRGRQLLERGLECDRVLAAASRVE